MTGAIESVRGEQVGPPPPFDGELAAVLDAFVSAGAPEITLDALEAMRASSGALIAHEDLTRAGAAETHEITVAGPPDAPDVTLLVCRPAGSAAGAAAAAMPLVYFMHGGGMMLGDRRLGFGAVVDWCLELGLVAVSVEYRLAPEHSYPAPVEDCYAGLRWVVEQAAELGADPRRIVIAGASAGGGLAASLAHLVRDRGGPALLGQLLMCPMLDDRNDSYSTLQMAGTGVWKRSDNQLGWQALLGERRGRPDVPPYAAAARATDHTGLPATFLDVGSAETFRDEGVAYANRIWQAGGQAELHVWPGGFHGFDLLAPHTTLARRAGAARLDWLRRLLTT
ncbi:Acetyl esterase/lipase [Frankia canadensis]|uniref:Acetyl esterase/lipase n=1 Tax=Frankia canadensis TaxID=1836972 RepID=A0A2I2KVL8_9ACTN|nr:alpha/beta hydrolase [Frankia canadensis]SNQ49711.1 Acetyl esterase/lipase [Frankia canadensis]SOU57001.1 Acetyl esterase/lipase [Frankia canadensis]